MSDDQLVTALAELRAARQRHAALLGSRAYRIGRLLVTGFLEIARGLRNIGRAMAALFKPAAAGAAMLDRRHQSVATVHPVAADTIYECSMTISAPVAEAKACLLMLEYCDSSGRSVGWEKQGASFSEQWGYFRYLPSSPAGATTTLLLEPPAGSASVRVEVIRWTSGPGARLRSPEVIPVDTSLDTQKADFRKFVAQHGRTLEDVSIVVGSPNQPGFSTLIEAELEHGTHVIGIYPIRGTAPSPGPRLHLFSRMLFDDVYQAMAEVGSGRRTLYLSDTDFYSVLQANFFRFAGWRIRTASAHGARETTVKSNYLREIAASS